MKTVLQKLNAAAARKMMQQNSENNRHLRRTVVDALKAAWMRGEYLTSHQGIAFCGDRLVDGQHRMAALAEMPDDFSIDMLVTYGVTAEAAKVMDIGLKRTAADVLAESAPVVEVARFLATIYTGGTQTTPTLLLPFVEAVRAPLTELLSECGRKTKVFSSAPFRAAAVVTHLDGCDFGYAKLVYRSMVLGDFDLMPRSGRALYRAVVGGRVTTVRALDAFARAMKIFDPKHADLVKVQITDQSATVEKVRKLLHRKVRIDTERVPAPAKRRALERAERSHQHHVGHG